jgi:hypothetical protein
MIMGWWLFAIAGIIVTILAIVQGSLVMGLVSLGLFILAGTSLFLLSKQKDLT